MAGTTRTAWHSVIAGRIQAWFEAGGRVAIREIGVVVQPGDVRTPDVTVFQDAAVDLAATEFAPEAVVCVVEVVTADCPQPDRVLKSSSYAAAGVGQFWLVEGDPEAVHDAVISVFALRDNLDGAAYELTRTVRLSELEQEFA